jgi:hypothetical protein
VVGRRDPRRRPGRPPLTRARAGPMPPAGPGAGGGRGHPPRASSSSPASSRERIRNRTPSGGSTENPLPRPGTTSMDRCVCRRYANCAADIHTSTDSATPGTRSAPSRTSAAPVRNSPAG